MVQLATDLAGWHVMAAVKRVPLATSRRGTGPTIRI